MAYEHTRRWRGQCKRCGLHISARSDAALRAAADDHEAYVIAIAKNTAPKGEASWQTS
jgi:hypothetical protein